MRQIQRICGIILTLMGFPVMSAMASTGLTAMVISVNRQVALRTQQYTVQQMTYVPLSAVVTTLREIHGSTMRGAPADEFTVYATWNKKAQTVIVRTPRYNTPMPKNPSQASSHLKLIFDGQTFSMPILRHADTTYIPISYVQTLLSHLQVNTSFPTETFWLWQAKPMTSSSTWVDEMPPFLGTDVTWKTGNKVIGALKNGTILTGYVWKKGTHFQTSAFTKAQSFQGRLMGKPFVVTLYTQKRRPYTPLLGIRYGGQIVTAFSPGYGGLYPINFTGKILVLRYASNLNQWLTISLPTGQHSLHFRNFLLSGFAQAMPPSAGYIIGPSYILGLSHRYPSIE